MQQNNTLVSSTKDAVTKWTKTKLAFCSLYNVQPRNRTCLLLQRHELLLVFFVYSN